MKDFQHVLSQVNDDTMLQHLNQHMNKHSKLNQQSNWINDSKTVLIKILAPVILTALTGPLTTTSILLQITNKPLIDTFSNKLKHYKPTSPWNTYIKNGILGDNKIYRPPETLGYHHALSQLGRQGLRGLYKGNLTGLILISINTKMREILYDKMLNEKNKSHQWQNAITVITCTLADFITLPLMTAQSRLVLQNSAPNFRTYSNALSVLRKSSLKILYIGSSLLFLKNLLFSLAWLSYWKSSPVYSFVFSSIISHLLIYPFTTVIRQLQCNSPQTSMMYNKKQSVSICFSRIWKNLGIKGFYRGFLGYSLVHFFLSAIMLQMNIRSGYFQIDQE